MLIILTPILTFRTFFQLKKISDEKKNLMILRKEAFYLTGGLIFFLLLIRDLTRMCMVQSLISDHIFYMDKHNYAIEENWLTGIREEIKEQREKHYNEAKDVKDVKEIDLKVFDESFSFDLKDHLASNRQGKVVIGELKEAEYELEHMSSEENFI